VAEDWQAVGFDPWSAGKRPLNTQHISNLSSKASEFFQDEKDSKAVMDIMRKEVMRDEYIEIEDTAGLNAAAAEVNTYALLADDFSKIASLVRHGKFEDVLYLIDQPDWSLPIDYQNETGNTLLHISCQNGSKRLIKLCIQRGADLNLANLNGQTALHFCFGYGYAEVGNYLVSKGADDSILNKDNLTCYEGLGAHELEML
jgi:ankyrin repeat protein